MEKSCDRLFPVHDLVRRPGGCPWGIIGALVKDEKVSRTANINCLQRRITSAEYSYSGEVGGKDEL